MNSICKQLKDVLATEGPRALQADEAAQQHLSECAACFDFLESLSAIEAGLHSLPSLDAPQRVVESLLARPEIAAPVPALGDRAGRPRSRAARLIRPRPLLWGSLAAGLLAAVLAVGLRDRLPQSATGQLVVKKYIPPASKPVDEAGQLSKEQKERMKALGQVGGDGRSNRKEFDARDHAAWPDASEPGSGVEGQARPDDLRAADEEQRFAEQFIADLPVPGRFYQGALAPAPGVQEVDGDGSDVHGSRERNFRTPAVDGQDDKGAAGNANSIEELEHITSGTAGEFGRASEIGKQESPRQSEIDRRVAGEKTKPDSPSSPLVAGVDGVTVPALVEASRVTPIYPEAARPERLHASVALQAIVRADGTLASLSVTSCDHPGRGFEDAALEAVRQWRFEPARQAGQPVDVLFTIVVPFEPGRPPAGDSLLEVDEATRLARAFLDERSSTSGLEFVSASGYWSNTYVPGDPAMRLLQSRLAGRDRSLFAAWVPTPPRLHDAARRAGQPFDSPAGAALAVYLHADRNGASAEGRLLVQVGLEGTARHGGRRPPMNLALVLDLGGEVTTEVAVAVRSLLEAFNRAREPGDRFCLLVAGRPGGLAVEPADFRHGTLSVTLDRALASGSGDGPALDVVQAVANALRGLSATDDPDAPLGTSAAIVVTSRPFGEATTTLADLAHQGAIAGISLSVVGIGPGVDLGQMDRVTLAGQGNRRLLDRPAGATELVDRELAAASRAIARAVRLRVRLAPGVKLVGVLGSERLDEARAQRVREAERSIDLRLARSLGIQADRGEDEEGIQIVLPGFYAGDSHVVLLDVVVPGAGPVADVTLRYKDLVQLRNGVSRASLALGRDERPSGPLEHNVLKNLLSLHMSRVLDAAGRAVQASDGARAAQGLGEFAALLQGLRRELPGLDADPDLLTDIALVGEYRALLERGAAGQPAHRDYLADSLRYAALLKVRPRPLETWS